MPWEKSFDIDVATDQAMQVFWAKGYEATSLSDLMKAMGINKGSFYNAFGNKKDLFIRSLMKYHQEQGKIGLSQLAALEDPVIAITTFYDGLIAQSQADSDRKGCFLVNTALDLPNHDPDTAKIVQSGMNDIQQFLQTQIERGQKSGVIATDIDAATTAKGLLASAIGIRVLARGVYDLEGLLAIKSQALVLIGK